MTIGLIRGRRVRAWAAVGLSVVNTWLRAASAAVVALSWALLLSMGVIARRNEAVGAPVVRPVKVL